MSAHLQFGPEWMRKAPAKSAAAGNAAEQTSSTAPTSASQAQAASVQQAPSTRPDNRRKASNGTGLSLGGPSGMGQVATSPSQTVVSPGAFSFAAAAGGAANQQGQSGGANERDRAGSSASALMSPGDGDAGRYSKRLLSLYGTENASSPQKSTSDNTLHSPVHSQNQGHFASQGQGAAATPTRKKGGNAFDRDARRNIGAQNDFAAGAGINGEPRGLNARAMPGSRGSTDDKFASHQRPGLFQRGSSTTTGAAPANLSPTTLQHRERERHGAGIQGGVLSGVAPAGGRKFKDGTVTDGEVFGSAKQEADVSAAAAASSAAERPVRAGNDAFASVGRTRQTSHRSNAGVLAPVQGLATPTANDQQASTDADSKPLEPLTKEQWARLRRERLPNEGPLGPPADHSGGFTRFPGLDRRRERVTKQGGSVAQHRARPSNGIQSSSTGEDDLPHNAYSLVDALKIDDDDDQAPAHIGNPQAENHLPAWNVDEAEWLYKDPSGQVQGPFKAQTMQDWYGAKYFTDDLLVRPANVDFFKPLGEVLGEIGNLDKPFLTPPSQYKVNALSRAAQDFIEPNSAFGRIMQAQRQPSRDSSIGTPLSGPMDWNSGMQQRDHALNRALDAGRQSPFVHTAFGGLDTASPFGTPPASFAELGGGHNRARQQEDYLNMIRQREMAEFRAMQDRNAMAQFGLDVDRRGMGPSFDAWSGGQGRFAQGQDWVAPAPFAHSQPFAQGFQQQQQQDQSQTGMQFRSQQSTMDAQGSQTGIDNRASASQSMGPASYQDPASWPITDKNVPSEAADQTYVQPRAPQDGIAQNYAHNEPASMVVGKTERGSDGNEVHSHAQEPSTNQVTESIGKEETQATGVDDDENAPERLWPQSPKAVEFASEPPLPADGAMFLDDFTTKSRRNRRDKKKREEEAEDAPTPAKSYSHIPSSVNVVNEEQFRRSQAGRNERSGVHGGAFVPVLSSNSAPQTTGPKAAPWASSVSTQENHAGSSLRDIQEAEERRADALKASQAERKQRAQAQVAPGSDVNLPTSMSWGLASMPSNINMPSSRDATANANGQVNGPVWSAGGRDAPKKTLTEIQEEERKRTQRMRDAQAAAAPSGTAGAGRGLVGKGYADSASRMQQAPTASAGPAPAGWSVVGAGGKASTPSTPSSTQAPIRPGAAALGTAPRTTSSSGLAGGALSGWATAGPGGKTSVAQSPSVAPSRPAIVNTPSSGMRSAQGAVTTGAPPPSAEFVQYCKEQLKGLSIKMDDFIEMLMQFPLDPSPDTMDIIIETVYANSSTLDGRRFASDFVAKRKLDAAGRYANGSGTARPTSSASAGYPGLSPSTNFGSGQPSTLSSAAAPRSASDVLRNPTSKAAGSDAFGGFKVVKGKGGKKRA